LLFLSRSFGLWTLDGLVHSLGAICHPRDTSPIITMNFSTFDAPLSTVFTFKATPVALPTLHFRKHLHRRSPKRSRPVADVDDLISESKKKRRLRLLLITSRLSRPFSTPATHIVDRGASKIAIWAKQKHLAPQVLRKAAIMNRVRRKTLERKDSAISVGEDPRKEVREACKEEMKTMEVVDTTAFGLGPNAVKYTDEAKYSVPPSPLGLSNYDAFDEEDDWYESYDDDEEGGSGLEMPKKEAGLLREDKQSYYSDFNYFEFPVPKAEEEEDDDDDPFHLSVLPSEIIKEKRPPSPPEDKMIELMREQQRQREITSTFLHFA